MSSNRVSILGCGWLGLPLAIRLKELGYTVKGSTTQPDKLEILGKKGITPYLIRIDGKKIDGEIEHFLESDTLIFNVPPRRIPDIETYYPNQVKTVVDQLKYSLVKNVLFISSTSVYPNIKGIITEETIPRPHKSSGIALVNAEKLIRFNDHFSSTILRLAGLIGPDRNPGNFLAGKKNLTGGKNPVNLIHLDDCIGIILSIIKNNCWNEIFNGCYPDHPHREEFYTKKAYELGVTPPTFIPELESDFKIISGHKIEKLLNYRYKVKI